MIVGIDEVGRGAWAGPLCVGAVCLGDDVSIEGLTDSKKLTPKKREKLAQEIKEKAAGVGLGWVSAKVIDQIGLSTALKLAAARAVSQINVLYDQIIIDGTVNLLQSASLQQNQVKASRLFPGLDPGNIEVVTMKRADFLVPSVSAASIVAKVARDEYMKVMGKKFPGYGFEGHVGYGTAAHTAAIAQLGPGPIHRMSFAPLKQSQETRDMIQEKIPKVKKGLTFLSRSDNMLREGSSFTDQDDITSETTKRVGDIAEERTADYLKKLGYVIIDRNWKTKWCEIDIVAENKGVIHFIEVKYRKSDRAGGGLAAITPKKLRQMKFAAELWLTGKDIQQAVLSAVEVSGDEFVISEFIEVI